jgi:hypothetical protein
VGELKQPLDRQALDAVALGTAEARAAYEEQRALGGATRVAGEPRPITIVSGGQTGVDRAALDAALGLGVSCGGWCPAGRQAEDGPIPARYPLQELARAGYLERTQKNVEDYDGTLVITFGPATGGTARTIEFCRKLRKSHLVIDAAITTVDEAVSLAAEFIGKNGVRRLNVAGPRASGEERWYGYALEVVRGLLVREAMTRTSRAV